MSNRIEKVLFVSFLSFAAFVLFLSIKQNVLLQSQTFNKEAPTRTPTSKPIPTLTSDVKGVTTKTQQVVNSDPIIDCLSSHPNCNGETIRLKRSQCSKIFCCGFSDGRWVLYPSEEKCKQEWQIQQTVPQIQKPTTKTQQLNFYCYDNTLKYSYYTSSGEQCNKDNYISSCKSLAKITTWDPCTEKCTDISAEGTEACLWAYFGQNAGIEDNFDLYQQCSKENSDEHSECLDACSPAYQEAMNKCYY